VADLIERELPDNGYQPFTMVDIAADRHLVLMVQKVSRRRFIEGPFGPRAGQMRLT
jgi:hypothetical protein